MFKTTLASLTLSAALASPASAQWVEQGSIADVALRSGMYQRQVAATRGYYYNATGVPFDGWRPNPYIPRCGGYYPGGGGGYYPAPAPRQYNYNNIGWGVNAGIGGSFGNFGGGGFNNFGWGLGIGVGGNSGSFGW